MTLKEWIKNGGDDPNCAGKTVQKYMDIEIEKEVRSVVMNYDEYMKEYRKTTLKTYNTHCFVILKNGVVIGFNENPSRGCGAIQLQDLRNKYKMKEELFINFHFFK